MTNGIQGYGRAGYLSRMEVSIDVVSRFVGGWASGLIGKLYDIYVAFFIGLANRVDLSKLWESGLPLV